MNDTYHSSVEHDSNSSLNLFRESPKKYWEIRIAKTRQPEPMSSSLELGIAFHEMILQPESMVRNYRLKSLDSGLFFDAMPWDSRKNMTPSMKETLINMAWSVCQNTKAVSLLDWSKGEVEKPYYATDPSTILKIKCRPDLLTKDGILLDIKTTAPKRKGKHPCSPLEFSRTIHEYGYHRQAAFYQNVLRLNGFDDVKHVLVAVSSAEPWGCAVYELDHESLLLGHDDNMATLKELAERRATNNWEETWMKEINKIGLPYWASRR